MSCYTSFTITQPFLGAPLQFTPALGSDEFELLIDCYVAGSASKQDKLSQVTIDFYNTATVDLNTGSLVKTYNVFPAWTGEAFEQSPTQSNSSGFSPAIYTPSPGSSVTLGDSAYGSMMTPSSRSATTSGRVSKKSKKDTKKTAETRLPGFSIMTRDGVDVTSSAGRGTKTKEQREHAHLMRQLKACADCKRKKVRCDPSHRRSHTEMSRASTSNGSSSSRISPAASTPSLQEATSFSTTNAFDDFILFPEDDMASWNPADLPMTDFASQDLSQFNWDINELDMNAFAPIAQDMDFSFPSYRQQSYSSQHQSPFSLPELLSQQPHDLQIADNIPGYAPLQSDQNSPDSWAEPQGYSTNTVVHTRPHSSSQLNSDQLGESWLLQGGDWNSGNVNVHAVNAQSVPGDSPRLDVPTNVPLANSQSLQNVASGVTPGELVHDGHTLHASLQVGDVVVHSNVQATSQGRNVPVSNVQLQSSLHLDDIVRLDGRQVVDRQSQSDPLSPRRDSESVRLDSRQHVSFEVDADMSLHIDVQLARNSPNANANVQVQSQQLGDWNFNELQPGSANPTQSQVSVQEPQSSEQQSIHCLNRQDQPQALEQALPVPVLMNSLSRQVRAVSSVIITVLNTVLLSGLALTLFSGSGPLAWVRDACLQSVGTNDSWMVLARLALIGSLVVGLFPEMLTSTSTQTPGCFGFGHVASVALAFFSGSVSSSGSSSACGWESISSTLFNGCLDARPSPSKTHDQSWTQSSCSSPSSFLLGLLEEITPATVGLV